MSSSYIPAPRFVSLHHLCRCTVPVLYVVLLFGAVTGQVHALTKPSDERRVSASRLGDSDSLDKEALTPGPADAEIPGIFVGLVTGESGDVQEDLQALRSRWHPGMVPMALESLRFSRHGGVSAGLVELLEDKTGQRFGRDLDSWYVWLWKREEQAHPHYADFKSMLYRNLDPLFAGYFSNERKSTIRLDEVRWGGVRQDGIPPLRSPLMIDASDADYLDDDNVVFGIEINGDARAYPKRILAWHEMFTDTIGGIDYAGVYCTLCGAVILYETVHKGVHHELGTSGFLYRSNKVMYDKATQSLWNTTWGQPVSGPLVGKGIQLERSYVVTTTWGEWRRRHPDTTVLSLDTGHRRDYREGAAYEDYFATDRLMFTVAHRDDRLRNKAEILALQFPDKTDKRLAISADFLSENPVYHHELGGQGLVVLTDGSGANRVYDPGNVTLVEYDGQESVTDDQGRVWRLSEDALQLAGQPPLVRLPAHRAFWFGWVAVWNDTELVM
ncbi:DUF3179 domain-containing protein [Granulosicoccus sp. 3-233]|uniref:DUF3179 domain-containing protein n=1 Tax=Granulosicoccus sp. 3-233 TaxID=3417969 RepID=UPI003D356A1F